MIKKGKDLKSGDIIKDKGIILEVDINPDSDGGEANYTYLDINDSYYGPGSTELNLEKDFEIITKRMDIVYTYKMIDGELAKYIADMVAFREKFRKIEKAFFNKYNKEQENE